MSKNDPVYALVTGASAGLGRAIATELAIRHYDLILTSLPDTGLTELCSDLEVQYDIRALPFEADMTDMQTPSRLKAFTTEKGIKISVLVNNVGIGLNGSIGSYSDELIEKMVMLNIAAATCLTNTFISDLKSAVKGYLLNIGSVAGFLPFPYKSLYSATKAYLYHFSIAVREELHSSGVSVSVAMPGPMRTNERVRESIRTQGKKAKLTVIDPEPAARIILAGLFRGKAVIIPGIPYSGLFYISKILPNGLLQMLTRNIFNKPG